MPDSNIPDRPGPFALFLATSADLGLSTTLRNVAGILAGAHHTVLLVDGRSGASGTRPPQPEPGVVHTTAVTGAPGLVALAEDPVATAYDHLLVEAPMPDSEEDTELARSAAYADTLVLCFAMTAWSIDGAAKLAEDVMVRRGGRPVRLLALGLKSDTGGHDRLREARERVRRKFAPVAASLGAVGIPFLEIPYSPLYQDSRGPAAEAEDTSGGLRLHYEQLADWLRARRTFRLTDVVVVHSARHDLWAAWLRDRLATKGVRTELRRADAYAGESPDAATALLFLAPDDADDTLAEQIGALSHTDVRIVLVDGSFPRTDAAHHEQIDLRDTTEEQALRLLYTGLGLGAPEPDASDAGARFPRLPATTNLGPPDRTFVDRADLLVALHEEMRAAARDGACLVFHGPSGWGKSDAAHELCHRYGTSYDVVWWVSAWQRQSAERDLAALAARLGAPEDRLVTGTDAFLPLLSRLSRSGDETDSWLIVFDGAPDPGQLRGLLPVPHERGHVVITSRTALSDGGREPHAPSPRLQPFAISAMSAEESRTLLAEKVPEITGSQARQIGGAVGFVPQALHLAARCLAERTATHRRDDYTNHEAAVRTAVDDVLAEYRVSGAESARTSDSVSSVAVMVQVARRLVLSTPGAIAWHAESPESDAVGWLLGAASLLSGRAMSLELLRSPRILSELAGDDESSAPGSAGAEVLLPDEHMVSVALWALSRVGLLDVDFDRTRQPLVQHHGLRDLIRAGMDPAERTHIESVLRSVLSEHAPRAPGLPADWALEVESLRLWEDPRPRVRRSLLRHLNALSQRAEAADLDRLLDIAARARAQWAADDSDEQSPEYLRLLNFVARAHRLRGDYDISRRFAQDALRGHRRLLGIAHPRSLLSADSYAAVLRVLGRFDDALLQLRPVLEGLTLLLGRQHPASVQAQHNLALTEALTGRIAPALAAIQDQFRYRQDVGGKDDPGAWDSADLLAYLYRAAGRDGEARDLLRRKLRRHGDTWNLARLRTEVGLAVSERRLADGFPGFQDPLYGYELAHERDLRGLGLSIDRFGPDRYVTVRFRFGYAADLHALGKSDEAELQARQCLETLARWFGQGHPCTGLGQVRHGVCLRSMGEVGLAEETGREGLRLLIGRLGRAHPWVAAAENSLAATLASAGREEEAVELARTALARLGDLGFAHRLDGRRVAAHLDRLTGTDTTRAVPPSGYDIDLELPDL